MRRSRSTKASRAVDALVERKIDPRALCYVGDPGPDEKIVLMLAELIEAEKDHDYVCVSWASQVEATDYYNAHGFIESLSRLERAGKLGGES